MTFGIEGVRRENGDDSTDAEHGVGLRFALHW